MRIGLSFDLRNAAQWFRPWAEFYEATFNLISEAERLNIEVVRFTEHHQFDDGYCPQPLTFLAAVAARTKRIRMSTGIMIAPLHSPVEVAEQAAMIDCISGGRVELALGLGYRLPEYQLFGVEFSQRIKLFEHHVREMRRLWGEGGITPRPVQGTIPLWAGLQGPKTTRLAGLLGMGRLHLPADHWDEYLKGLDDGGHGRASARLGGTLQAILSDDPERTFNILAPRIEHNRYTYAYYAVDGTDKPKPEPLSSEELKKLGMVGSQGQGSSRAASGGQVIQVLTPDQAAQQILSIAGGRKIDSFYLPGAVSGVVDDISYRHIELFATKLRPLLERANPA